MVLHEAIHVWGRHAKRSLRLLGEKPATDRLGIWRQAVDAAVNDVLEQSGLKCPDEGITPAKLGLPRNKTPEEYFAMLLERQQKEEDRQRESKSGSRPKKTPQTTPTEQPAQDNAGELG